MPLRSDNRSLACGPGTPAQQIEQLVKWSSRAECGPAVGEVLSSLPATEGLPEGSVMFLTFSNAQETTDIIVKIFRAMLNRCGIDVECPQAGRILIAEDGLEPSKAAWVQMENTESVFASVYWHLFVMMNILETEGVDPHQELSQTMSDETVLLPLIGAYWGGKFRPLAIVPRIIGGKLSLEVIPGLPDSKVSERLRSSN